MELATWLQRRSRRLGESWLDEIRMRGAGRADGVDGVVGGFVAQIVDLLPWLLGPYREQVQPLWLRLAELFGAVAAKRGLAAGEVIEEFQILRELIIRDLFREPPLGGSRPLSLREILRLNRALDRGVTQASVGHTDAMFFQLFHADDAPVTLSREDVAEEAAVQLDMIRDEFAAAVGRTAVGALEGAGEP